MSGETSLPGVGTVSANPDILGDQATELTDDSPFVSFRCLNEDVGIYLEDQIVSGQCTPCDTDTLNACLVDSGYNESLNLHCLESVVDLKPKLSGSTPQDFSPFRILSCKYHNPEHKGFEEHLDDIYYHRLSIEYKYQVATCLENQPEVTPGIRGLLISWMTGLHHQLALCQDTLFIAVNVVDRILDLMQASRDYLQLLGVTALLIASKAEEVHPPEIKDLIGGCDNIYTRAQVKQLERVILNAIRFDLMVPTSQFFLEYFASYCLGLYGGFQGDQLRQARALARCLLELSLQDYELTQLRPSMLAFCVWKVAVDDTNADDGNFVPPALFFTREDFEIIYTEVKSFTENLKQSFPELLSICEHYFNLYGAE